MKGQRERLNRRLRLEMVWEAINAAPAPVSVGDICALTGLKRTPYLADIINELLAHNYIRKGLATGDNGHAKIVYWTKADPVPQLDILTL